MVKLLLSHKADTSRQGGVSIGIYTRKHSHSEHQADLRISMCIAPALEIYAIAELSVAAPA